MKTLARFSLIGFLLITFTGYSNVIFFDDFSGTDLDVSTDWTVATNTIGRTQFGLTPTLSNGMATFNFNTYNSDDPGGTFRSSEIFTQTEFSRGSGKRFEARLRINSPVSNGLVAAVFPFGFDPATVMSDEIDVELLSNWLNDPAVSDQIKLVTWDNIDQNTGIPERVSEVDRRVTALDAFDFNTYRIDWLEDRVDTFVNDTLVNSEIGVVPDDPMNFHLNWWAPNSNFVPAFDANLQPVGDAASNSTYTYDVDFVRVSTIPAESNPVPEPSTYALFCLGLAAVVLRHRKSKNADVV